jgi:hypothetical protein
MYLPFPPIYATCPTHPILLDFIIQIIIGEEYRSLSSSVYSFHFSPVTSYLLGPSILLSIMFSNTPSLCSCLSVSDKVAHTLTTTGKIIVPYILIFVLFDGKLEDKRFCT